MPRNIKVYAKTTQEIKDKATAILKKDHSTISRYFHDCLVKLVRSNSKNGK